MLRCTRMQKARSVRVIGPNLAKVAALIGEPARARMLFALMEGREFSASELAYHAGASAQASSAHLAKLVAGGLLSVRSAGRQRLFKLASDRVAEAIETLASIAPVTPISSLTQQTAMVRLREARSCYDHLAGRLGVAVTNSLLKRGAIAGGDGGFHLTQEGERIFATLGVDIERLRDRKRSLVRACMDWTERRWHLAGSIGASLLEHFVEHNWLQRSRLDRSLSVTSIGRAEFSRRFGPID
jgi:DNA-binding transcriptional ArsR family regulator